VYGTHTLDDVQALCEAACASHGFALDFRQSNHEGELVEWLHEAGRLQAAGQLAGVILNAGAYTHTSVALHDAIKGTGVPLIELHISNVHAREPFRHHSFISPAAKAVMAGFGVQGYALAVAGLAGL
jgi:3-dehydroquinate dehydratase-2